MLRFSRALTIAPTHAQSLRLASLLAQNLGRHEESMTLHLKAVALDPLNTNAHRNLGNHYLVVGQLDKAELAFTKALALQPTATIAYFALEDCASCRLASRKLVKHSRRPTGRCVCLDWQSPVTPKVSRVRLTTHSLT